MHHHKGQIYKIFVENRPIIICEKNTFPLDCILLFAERLTNLEKDVFTPYIDKQKPKHPVIILSPDAHFDFQRLFAQHSLISAAGGIVRKKNKYLFIKRLGKWDIPKGKLEAGESSESGAIREIQEECGISEVKIERFIGTTYHTYTEKKTLILKKTDWYAFVYEGDETLVPQKEEGITKTKWIKEKKLDKIRSNTYESIIEVIDMYFK